MGLSSSLPFVEGLDPHSFSGVILRTLKEGSYFGEVALLMTVKRVVTVRASEEPCHLFILSKDRFDTLVMNYPVLGLRMRSQLKNELRQTFTEPKHTEVFDRCLQNPLLASVVHGHEDGRVGAVIGGKGAAVGAQPPSQKTSGTVTSRERIGGRTDYAMVSGRITSARIVTGRRASTILTSRKARTPTSNSALNTRSEARTPPSNCAVPAVKTPSSNGFYFGPKDLPLPGGLTDLESKGIKGTSSGLLTPIGTKPDKVQHL
jgi:CRP-like cAMP-binding protein